MALKSYKPTTPSQRNLVIVDRTGLYRGKPVKLYFIQQPQARPPTFLLSVNFPEGVHFSYRRYLTNQLRESFDLDGTPVRIVCRAKGEKGRPSRRKKESEKAD